MSQMQPAAMQVDDLAVIRECVERPSPEAWERFFMQFEARFVQWIRNTLRDSSEAERDDAYQDLATRFLLGKILGSIDLTRPPEPFLQNLGRKRHRRTAGLPQIQLEDDDVPIERLRVMADQALGKPEDQLLKLLREGVRNGARTNKRLAEYSAILDELLKEKKIEQIAVATGISKSTVQRHRIKMEQLAYAALNTPLPKEKKV